MENQEIIDFIKKSRSQGSSDDAIKASLESVGWDSKSISASFAFFEESIGPVAGQGLLPSEIASLGVPLKPADSAAAPAQTSSVPEATPTNPAPAPSRQVSSLGPKMIVPEPGVMSPVISNKPQGSVPSLKTPQVSQPAQAPVSEQVHSSSSEVSFKKTSFGKTFFKIFLAFFVLTAIVSLSFFYVIVAQGKTVFGYNLMDKVWQNLILSQSFLLTEQKVSLDYQDTGEYKVNPSDFVRIIYSDMSQAEIAEVDNNYGFLLKDPKLQTSLSAYADTRNVNQIKADGSFEMNVSNNDKDYSMGLDFKILEESDYLKYSMNNTLLNFMGIYDKSIIDSINKTQNKWYGSFSKASNKNQDSTPAPVPDPKNQELGKQLSQIFSENRIFEVKSFHLPETINGRLLLHYELSLNKAKVKNIMLQSFDAYVASSDFKNLNVLKAKKIAEEFINIFLEKYQVSSWHAWVGVSDRQIYKLEIKTNAPSLVGTLDVFKNEVLNNILTPMINNLQKSRANDAQRLVDMRKLSSALELFYNDYGGYPESANGKPMYLDGVLGGGLSGAKYLNSIPTPPPADGKCTDFYNNYWYTPVGQPQKVNIGNTAITVYPDYKYSFCLGDQVGSYAQGNYYMQSTGIKPLDDCPPSRQCYKPADVAKVEESSKNTFDLEEILFNFLKQMPFTASSTISFEAKSYNQERAIEAPKDYIDLEGGLKELEKDLGSISL